MATEKRLIDANELVDTIYKSDDMLHSTQWETDEIVDQIDRIPTVDAVEVVHERWLTAEEYANQGNNGWLYCSVCEQPMREFYGWGYCPNCGAKMDGNANAQKDD